MAKVTPGMVVGGLVISAMFVMIWIQDQPNKAKPDAENEAVRQQMNKNWLADHPAKTPFTPSPEIPPQISPQTNASTVLTPSLIKEAPKVGGIPVPPAEFSSEAEKNHFEYVAKNVKESVDEIAFVVDATLRTIVTRSNRGPRSPSRMEFLYICLGLIEDANEKTAVRKKYGLIKIDGKYRFEKIRDGVVSDLKTANNSGILVDALLGKHR